MKTILRETSGVLRMLEKEVVQNWAKKKSKYTEGELLYQVEGMILCNIYHLEDFLTGWRHKILNLIGESQVLKGHWDFYKRIKQSSKIKW